MELSFEEAVAILRNAVKTSHLDNQKHIDFSLVNANERDKYQKAMMVVNFAVTKGELTKEELQHKLGLI